MSVSCIGTLKLNSSLGKFLALYSTFSSWILYKTKGVFWYKQYTLSLLYKLIILKIRVLMNYIGNCKSFLYLILSHLIFREIPLTFQVLTHMINLYILPSNLFFTLEDISISNLLDREFHIWSYVWGFSKWNFSLNLCLVNYACWLWTCAWGLQSSERNLNFNHLHF